MNLAPHWQYRLLIWLIRFLLVPTAAVAAYVLWLWYRDEGSFETVYTAVLIVLGGLWFAHGWLQGQLPQSSVKAVPAITEQTHGRTRENLLNLIRHIWIDGFLKQSLHSEVIKLAMSYRPDAINQRPWQMVLQQSGKPDQPVPPDSTLVDIFTRSGRSLLILGNPGSGKTITMLQLADTLLAAAERDSNEPIPVIMNLSSWARTKGKLSEWLVEEIFTQYGLKRDLTRAWIAGNQFVYLLDGLDEVAEAVRDDCITAINEFKAEHSAEMVICSRTGDYEKLERRLLMGAAVQMQPLTHEQVNEYLARGGKELQAVRTTLKTDAELRELATEPLMLSMMTLAYQGVERIDLRPRAGKAERRRHIFDNYIQRMLTHRPLPKDSPYTEQQALDWLKNLAAGMVQHNQSIFYIDELQPSWLTEGWRSYYQRVGGLLAGLLVGGLAVGLVGGLTFGLISRWVGLLLCGLGCGLGLGLMSFGTWKIGPFSEELAWEFPSLLKASEGLTRGLIFGLRFGLIGGAIGGLSFGLISGLIRGLVFGLIGGMIGGLLFGLFLGLIGGLATITIKSKKLSQRTQPNRGVRRARKNALRMALLFGLIGVLIGGLSVGVIGGVSFGLIGGLTVMLRIGMPTGLISGLIAGLIKYGGSDIFKHYALRYILFRAGVLPYPFRTGCLVAYLDSMKDRLFLRRVGGGWIFIHRTLMEHFAELAGDAVPYFGRGTAQYQLGNIEAAIADYNKAIELDPNYVSAYRNRGSARYERGSLQGAVADFNKAIELDPKISSVYLGRGVARSRLGDLNAAITDYTRSIELTPAHAPGYLYRGVTHYILGKLEAAIVDYNKAIELDPKYAIAYAGRADALYDQGNLEAAITDYTEAIRLDSGRAYEYNNRGWARYQLGDYLGAMRDCERAVELRPDVPDFVASRAAVYQVLGRTAEAIADFERVLELTDDPSLVQSAQESLAELRLSP
jgi:eukaryotic-like serine/threonine-protein kinase